MARYRQTPRTRQIVVYALILAALFVLSTMGYIVISGRDAAAPTEDREIVVVDTSHPPTMDFPERLRTFDSHANLLIDRFIRTTRRGQYSEFRKMWTRKLDPISAESYERIYGRIREVRVLSVEPVGGPPADEYLLTAEVRVGSAEQPAERPTRTIRIRIIREEGEWVFAPPSKPDDGGTLTSNP